jgi:carbamate kinase
VAQTQATLGFLIVTALEAALRAQGEFGSGSMGPKVQAALAFVDGGGSRAVITSLARLREGVEGAAGTRVSA